MTATHDLLPDLSRMADDGCPNHPDADRSTLHTPLAAATAGPARPRASLVARLLGRLWG